MHRLILGVVGVLLLAASVEAQTTSGVVESVGTFKGGDVRIVVRVPKGTPVPFKKGTPVDLAIPQAPPPPEPVHCAGTWSAWAPTGDWGACVGGTQTRTESRTFTVTTPPSGGGLACPASPETRTASQSCTVEPPPTTGTLWGVSDPAILGDFTAAEHDAYSLDGGDGFRYRTWHPQCVGTRCFAHEHGDNPAIMTNAEIASQPVLFGYVGRRHPMPNEPNGHEEPHEGFKVFISNPGDVNDENRINRAWSRSVFHMGTGGPRRFTTSHHSADIRVIHPEFGLKAFTRLMMDTGGTGIVCDPRSPAPIKDVIALDFSVRCNGAKLGSSYEIWSTEQVVRNAAGDVVYRAFATPAAFDPVTLFNPANPTEVVYAWDPRVVAIKQFPGDTWWDQFRGCERESYAQPGYWYNAGGPTAYYTDAVGQPVASTHPLALRQEISASASIGAPTTNDGLGAFKMRVGYCHGTQHSAGAVSPRPGIAGTTNKAKLGLKN
jgi:hypothetical protein